MGSCLKKLLTCPVTMFGGVILISLIALAAALYSEVALGLEPCILCIYQRIPFVLGIFFGIAGLILRNKPQAVFALLSFIGITFLVNSGIALYHTGVEQKWWASAVEGCSVPNFGETPQSMLENILSAPTGNCAEIPWQDPILGLSMANYNVILCLGIAVVFFASVIARINTAKQSM